MSSPIISVIIPVYATPAHFLREAISSIQAQTDPRWELVVSLDAATPECAAVAREAAAADPARIRVVGLEGGTPTGLSATRNRGVAVSVAPFLAFLDADDVIVPEKHAEQLALFEQYPTAMMVYGRSIYWSSWIGTLESATQDYQPLLGVPSGTLLQPPKMVTRQISGRASVPPPCDILVHRSAVEGVGGFNESFRTLYEDQMFFGRIGMLFPVLPVDKAWAYYRQHPSSMTHVASSDEEIAARRKFLLQLEQEARAHGVLEGELAAAIRLELWKLNHPTLAWGVRKWQRLIGRIPRIQQVLSSRSSSSESGFDA